MASKDSRTSTSSSSSSVLDWSGPHTVIISRAQTDFGFTLRHLVVYPPQSVLGDSGDDHGHLSKDSRSSLSRELSNKPQETIFVKSVKEGSPACHAGLSTGDRILAVNGDSVSVKSYRDVIAAIQQSDHPLKLLVVPKDEDILQMAYQSQARDCMFASSSSLSDNARLSGVNDLHHHSHSSSDIVHGTLDQSFDTNCTDNLPYGHHEIRHSYPLSQWGITGAEFRVEDFSSSSPSQIHTEESLMSDSCLNQVHTDTAFVSQQQPTSMSQDTEPSMTSNITYNIPSRSKYSFGLYFTPSSSTVPPESTSSSHTASAENLGRGYKDASDRPGITKSQTFEVGQRRPSVGYRKTSLDENSALSSSARSRDYFIRYSSDKAASDNRNRYSPRYSSFERYSNDNRPTYIISRSQTVSTISPSSNSSAGQSSRTSSDYVKPTQESSSNTVRSCQYIPVISENKRIENIENRADMSGFSQNPVCSEKTDPSTGSRTFLLSIPCGQQTQQQSTVTEPSFIPVRQRFGTTYTLTRSPTAAHIEIQKSIGKPIVSQRKYQFESRNENTPQSSNVGHSRYKTEIDKIRTQPKFSSFALRKASFEQSPDRDPPGYDESFDHEEQAQSGPSMETAQPTVKVRRVSSDRYTSGSPQQSEASLDNPIIIEGNQDTSSIKIMMSPDNSCASAPHASMPNRESINRPIFIETGQSLDKSTVFKSSRDGYFHSPSNSISIIDNSSSSSGGGGNIGTGLADSGVWMKSYHSSSDMLDGADEVSGAADSGSSATDQEGSRVQRSEQTHKTYLSTGSHSVQRSSSNSLSSVSSGGVPVANVAPTVMSVSDGSVTVEHTDVLHDVQVSGGHDYAGNSNGSVAVRKKLQDSLEDQATKLHRRTSYLMATARDRTDTVPLEETFNATLDVINQKPQQSGGTARRNSSVKLNKFFGEMIPSIAEGVEMKSTAYDEAPEIIRKGPLSCKISAIEGKKCGDRSWKSIYAVLRPTELFLTRDKESGSASSSFEDQHIPLRSCTVEFARDYAKKKKNVFRLSTPNECDYLFQTEDRGMMMCWIQGIKSIIELERMEKGDDVMTSEREKHVQSPIEINIIPSSKTSPQMSHKGKKLSALSFKSKLTSSPNMKRKKSNATEKDKEEGLKKGWKDRIPMMKSLKKHNEDLSLLLQAEQDVDTDKFQFGVPLEDCFPSPHNEYVPLIVELCTRIVEARGLEVVGVYRVPGNSAAVTALTEEFNRGIDSVNIDNEKLLDINVISSLLKSFFRKLPEPLIHTDMYEAFIEANRYPDEDKRKLKIKRLLHLLPAHHNETLKHMAEHLNKVASYGNINKMDAKNLAIMFGPTLVRKKGDDTISLVTDMSDQCRIVESIILHHDWFFSPWDQDSYIPMETTVETVPVEEGQNLSKDDDEAAIDEPTLPRDGLPEYSAHMAVSGESRKEVTGMLEHCTKDGCRSEEADSAISTKEIISSIVGAASKKLRQQQQQKSLESLDMVDNSSIASTSTFRDRNNSDAAYLTSFAKSMSSINSSLDASEEYLGRKSSMPTARFLETHVARHNTSTGSDLTELEFADASSPSSGFSGHLSDDFLHDKNDELEISHGLGSSLSRDAINRLKRIGENVTALLHTFEQKQQKERERRRWEQEMVEREHFRTQLELEQEDSHSVDDWLAWETGLPSSGMPDLVSSSYFGETFPYGKGYSGIVSASDGKKKSQDKKKVQQNSKLTVGLPGHSRIKVASVSPQIAGLTSTAGQPCRMCRGGSHENILSYSRSQDMGKPVVSHKSNQRRLQDQNQQKVMHLAVGGILQRPSSLRGRRHGSLDSLIDMIDKQEKRISWASTDSEDGSDLLTSITATFDQKLEILLNPKYKLTGTGKKSTKHEVASSNSGSTSEGAIDWDSIWQTKSVQSKPSTNAKQVYAVTSLLESDRPFRDPSLHRSTRSDPKIGIASRFERNDINRTASSSPGAIASSNTPSNFGRPCKDQLLDTKTILGKPLLQPKDLNHVFLAQPNKFETGIIANISLNESPERKASESKKTEETWHLPFLNQKFCLKDKGTANGQNEEHVKFRRHIYRRHTVGGIEDFSHSMTLSQLYGETSARVCSAFGYKLPTIRILRPSIRDLGTRAIPKQQTCVPREIRRGSTPDLL